jgi:hypothetical protein
MNNNFQFHSGVPTLFEPVFQIQKKNAKAKAVPLYATKALWVKGGTAPTQS